MGTALMVVDLQNDFLGPYFSSIENAEPIIKQLVSGINEISCLFREAGLPVFFIRMIYKADGNNWTLRMKDLNTPYCIEGTPGSSFFQGLNIEKSDILITKVRYSAFYGTNLDDILRKKSIDTLVITGMNTHACVRATVIDAFERDYRIFLPLELVNSYNIPLHEQTIAYLQNRVVALTSMKDIKERILKKDFTFKFS
jgi:bifunctional isochorismate lyase/aryl carrier protein